VIKTWPQHTAIRGELRHDLETRSDFRNFRVMSPIPGILLLREWVSAIGLEAGIMHQLRGLRGPEITIECGRE
jgi:hypothetical protein